jgi:hypothetical protein
MRELKFRAWDKKTNRYNYKGILHYWLCHVHTDTGECPNSASFIIEQFTGLHDKRGKEIYEGDIIEYNKNIFVVIFKYGAFGYKYFGDFHWLVNYNKDDLEVIGNIHENPELLEARP